MPVKQKIGHWCKEDPNNGILRRCHRETLFFYAKQIVRKCDRIQLVGQYFQIDKQQLFSGDKTKD